MHIFKIEIVLCSKILNLNNRYNLEVSLYNQLLNTMRTTILFFIISVLLSFKAFAQPTYETDTITGPGGQVVIGLIGHGSLYLEHNKYVIHIDPVNRYGDYTKMPKADAVLITHHHGDHLNTETIHQVKTEKTKIFLTQKCTETYAEPTVVLKNGESADIYGFKILAVPAYNLVHMRDGNTPFHPKGEGNGYVISVAGINIYVAGDTENIPEMAELKYIDIAFLPMNLPFTMTPQMVTEAAAMIKPRILYPYHFGNTNMDDLLQLMKEQSTVEVRVRKMN